MDNRKKTRPKISFGFAGAIDDLMAQGITWDELITKARAEAEQHGINPIMATLDKLKAHANYRSEHDGWFVVMDDKRVWLRIPFTKNWGNWGY